MKKVPVADQSKCSKCNTCVDICPKGAISVISNSSCAKCIKYCISFVVPCHPEYVRFDYNLCDSCGDCIEKCPSGAISWADPETARLKKIEQQ